MLVGMEGVYEITGMGAQARIVVACAIVVVAYLVDFLCCKLIVPLVRRIAARTTFNWDNYLTDGNVLHNVFHLIPPVTFQVALPLLYPGGAQWTELLSKALNIYIIVISCRLVCGFITSLYDISAESRTLRNKPMKGVYQMLKVIVVCIGVILTIGILIEKDFTTLIAGLGASAAVLMLVFKDTILGLVAGVQLSAHDMLRPGDWIMLDKFGIDGVVEEVTLNTVKVRSWDNTIVTIPPYVLVSDAFKNWRGMRESGGRRVARCIRIDMNSIRFCTAEELQRFSAEPWARGFGLASPSDTEQGRADKAAAPFHPYSVVNLKLFRAAIEHYLRNLPAVNSSLMLMVRQLEPTSEGLPLQLYFFTAEKDWVPHENIASDVLEHVIASMPAFGLRVFQRPSGADIMSSDPVSSSVRS